MKSYEGPREGTPRAQRLKRDVVINVIAAVVKAAATLWVVRLAGETFLPVMLGVFLLARRISSTGSHLLQLGISQFLLRYIPMLGVKETDAKRKHILFAAMLWLTLAAVCIPLAYMLRDGLAKWWFPETAQQQSLAFWTVLLMVITVLHFIIHATVFAERWIVAANVIDGLNVSGYLILCMLILKNELSPASLMSYQTAGIMAMGTVVLIYRLARLRTASCDASPLTSTDLKGLGREFIRYGMPRGGVAFLDTSVLLIGPWMLREVPEESGFLIIALTLMRVIPLAIMPVTKIASVVTARLLGEGDQASIVQGIRMMFGITLHISVLSFAVLLPWRNAVVHLWLKKPELAQGAGSYFTVLCWGIVPLSVFYGLRGIIEVRWVRPLNLFTLTVALSVQFVLFMLLGSFLGEAQAMRVSMVTMFCVMGVMTLLWVRSDLRGLGYWGVPQLAVAASLLALVNTWGQSVSSLWAIIITILASAGVVGLLWIVLPSEFMRQLRSWAGNAPKLVPRQGS